MSGGDLRGCVGEAECGPRLRIRLQHAADSGRDRRLTPPLRGHGSLAELVPDAGIGLVQLIEGRGEVLEHVDLEDRIADGDAHLSGAPRLVAGALVATLGRDRPGVERHVPRDPGRLPRPVEARERREL